MASVTNSLAAQADARIEEKSYVKIAVFKIIDLVNAIFGKICTFFSSLSLLFEKREKNEAPNEAPVSRLVDAPVEPLPAEDRKWEVFKTYMAPEEILDLFYSEKVSQGEREALYLKIAQAKRISTCSLLKILTKIVMGDSKEQKLYEGKVEIRKNPHLIVPFLRTKI